MTMVWEYNLWISEDPEGGKFHRWWVKYLQDQGDAYNRSHGTNFQHLIAIEYGGEHPNVRDADFIVNEATCAFFGGGVWTREGVPLAQSHGVPVVHWSVDSWHSEWMTHCGELIPHSEEGYPSPCQIRELITWGWHPAGNFHELSNEAKQYYLQARWYLENIRTWNDEVPSLKLDRKLGDEINLDKLPVYTESSRPSLKNVAGYTNGIKENGSQYDFACIYKDPDNDPPAQAEVWVDLNNDGRFDPNPAHGERITMQRSGTDYRRWLFGPGPSSATQ